MSAVRRKKTFVEYRIELVGRLRTDGSLFVTSPNLRPFSAVLPNGKWEGVLEVLKVFLKANVGPVKDMRLIRDASELVSPDDTDNHPAIPPAYVVAELTHSRASAR
jgi:hypothetical protein